MYKLVILHTSNKELVRHRDQSDKVLILLDRFRDFHFLSIHFGEGYLAGQSRQIISYLAGQSRQIISYLAGHVPPNNFLFGGTCPSK